MIAQIKRLIKRLINPHYCSNEKYIHYLRQGGAKIGDHTIFYNPELKPMDETSLPFIEIGDNCRITRGVIILAHDYSYAVLRPVFHEMLLKVGVTRIGNNVFIGMNSIILMNSDIGDNVVIGAGSVVNGKIPSNCVVAGNPARVICDLDAYHKKLSEQFINNAILYHNRKRAFLKREVKKEEMAWFNVLWKQEDTVKKAYFTSLKVDGDDHQKVVEDVMKMKPIYESYEDFLQHTKKDQ